MINNELCALNLIFPCFIMIILPTEKQGHFIFCWKCLEKIIIINALNCILLDMAAIFVGEGKLIASDWYAECFSVAHRKCNE